MRIRHLTKAELNAIRDRNYRARHFRQISRKTEHERKGGRKPFRERRRLPHGPWGRCPVCNDATKQRVVYAFITVAPGKRVWEKIFMLCRRCLAKKRNPLIPVKAKIYTSNQPRASSPMPILSILNEGPLTLDRLIQRLRKAGIKGNEFRIRDAVIRPWVESGLISEAEVEYTRRVLDIIKSSKMRLRECKSEKTKTMLPLYVQSRKGDLKVEQLGYYCITCKKFVQSKPRETMPDAIRLYIMQQLAKPKEKDPIDVLLEQAVRRDAPTTAS
ncbi:MAG: hypothetical protein ACREBS_01910 [Nitrososphaerales archaeon]